MAKKTKPRKKNARKKGRRAREKHLAEANRAMSRAWDAISRRQNKSD